MQIAEQKVVTIDYTLKSEEGDVIDTSSGKQPLSYLHGAGNIVPGLEEALSGKAKGDDVSVKVPADKGYGTHEKELVQAVPRDRFPTEDIEVGMQFQAEGGAGPVLLRVVDVADDKVTVDANHPLAGQTLCFNVKVVDVRDATAEELQHGHVHGAGGHQH